jgi:hypothetical protein
MPVTFKRKAVLSITTAAVLNLVSGLPGFSQSQTEIGLHHKKIPQLAGHTFMPTTLSTSPFIRTQILNATGVGGAPKIELDPIIIGDTEIPVNTGDMIFVVVSFAYRHAIKTWLGLNARLDVSARIGKKKDGFLAQGVTSIQGFNIGWLVKLKKTRSTMLSGTLGIWNAETRFINIVDFLEEIIETGIDADAKITRKFTSLRGGAGLAFAWGISPLVGLNAFAQAGYGESIDARNKNEWFLKLNSTVDFDLAKKTAIPLHIGVGYGFDTFSEFGDDISENLNTILFRIGYLHADAFSIGLESSTARLPLRKENRTLSLSTVVINLRYYF